ncbi:MFS transporter [Bailinhaonella thermotolerans]|uniref:MFS transporter n=1 Tax=Bailinhaonella thermotolerans TaxID=1070861 RepID=A0A3A4BBF4_9ACTN|nr:MFS transporter [Bailinhaonella thermotolerans]RJL35873.1 MFS transporter [Bailinhaonella thermotolerans]
MTTSAPHRRAPGGVALALLGLGSLITALDFTIVYVALPDIAREVGFTSQTLQWVISAYAVLYGGFLLLGGRLADIIGRRRMFVAGMLLYGAGSVLGGLATEPAPLIGARVIQGVGGAVLFPATLSLVVTLFAEGPARNRAVTVWSVAGASGLSLGALLGGVLTSAFGWEAVFYVNVPLAVLGAAAAFAVLPADGARQRGRGFDLPGALVGTAGVTGLVFAIAQGPEWGWASPGVLGTAVVSLVLLAGFLAIEARSRNPLMPLRLFANRSLSSAAGIILIFGLTLQSIPYFLTLYFQDVLGYSALQTGLAFLAPTLAMTAGNLVSERLIPRFGTRPTLILSLVVAAAGTAGLAAGVLVGGSYLTVLAGIIGYGLGTGITFNTMWIAATTGVAPEEQGTASGISSTVLQAGTGAGLAVLVAVANAGTGGLTGQALKAATAGGLRDALLVIAAGALAGGLIALRLPGRPRRVPQPAPASAPAPAPAREKSPV